jgi:hypothetical protein
MIDHVSRVVIPSEARDLALEAWIIAGPSRSTAFARGPSRSFGMTDSARNLLETELIGK